MSGAGPGREWLSGQKGGLVTGKEADGIGQYSIMMWGQLDKVEQQ